MREHQEEEEEDPREIERLSYIARKECEQKVQIQARLELRKEAVLNAIETSDKKVGTGTTRSHRHGNVRDP